MMDRDQVIREHILKEDKLDHANSHLGDVNPQAITYNNIDKPWSETSKYRVALIMTPAWGVLFPPYNLAKLTGLLREYDYSIKVYDLNIESYQSLDKDYWRGENYFLWTIKENFNEKILPNIKPLFDKVIQEVVDANPKVIGFSIYNTNIHASEYMVNELKRLLPNSCFIAGGPEVATGNSMFGLPFNYEFVGESEETLLSFLENIPQEYETRKKIGSTDSKLKLENYPFPDYSDYNLSNYQHPDGVSIETSRGCVAQCSFCSETYFWKFRSNTPDRVVEELEYQKTKYGVKRFWFVDSLVNGNLKVFERIIDLIIEKKLDIKWNSYARCDGRMERGFIQKIKDSGCTCISYGVESGSQKVLNDMRKKVDIWEIENNLQDGKDVGLFNHVNWMIGFPTEEPIDFLHSLQLLANSRKHIDAISPGFGAGPAQFSHMQTDWKVYDIVGDNWLAERTFLNAWYTTDYKNTILHRFIRIKLFHVWLEILKDNAESVILNSQRYHNIKDYYTFETTNSCKEYMNYDEYVNLNKFEGFEGSIANEYLSLVYGLFTYFGSFTLSVKFNPDIDKPTFGDWLVNDYIGNFSISVTDTGDYKMTLFHKFKHDKDYEKLFKDQSFGKYTKIEGNLKDLVSKEKQTKETVHEQYRKKVITILPASE